MKIARPLALTSALVLGCACGALAFAQTEKPKGQPPAGHEMPLPKGWTQADMEACMAAGMPGEQHEFLKSQAGTWRGKETFWMGPDAEPMTTTVTSVSTPIMDGHYVKNEITGEIPGMGPFSGMNIMGFDNASQKFVASWIDSHSTGIWQGTGTLSPDRKTMTMNYNYTCPITKKMAVAREVTTFTSQNAMTMEMFTTDPKTNKEYKMMRIEFTK